MPNASPQSQVDHLLPNLPRQLTIVPNRPLRTRLLLAGADAEALSTRTLQLSNSGYQVATAGTSKEVFDLRFVAIHLAVLSDSLGSLGLRSVAEDVRRQWPLARVLIIGAAQVVLDDPLYDEAVERRISTPDLLAALTKLAAYSSNQRVEVFRQTLGGINHEKDFERARKLVPVESDPTKDRGYDSPAREEPQDLPADERKDWRAV
jgi:hypothetical protein